MNHVWVVLWNGELKSVEETHAGTEEKEQHGTQGKQKSTENLVEYGHGVSPQFSHGWCRNNVHTRYHGYSVENNSAGDIFRQLGGAFQPEFSERYSAPRSPPGCE